MTHQEAARTSGGKLKNNISFVQVMGKDVRKVCPPAEELFRPVEKNVKCNIEGCDQVCNNHAALNMHLVKKHKVIQDEKYAALYYKRKHQEGVVHYHCPEQRCVYNMQSERYFSCLKYLKQHYLKVHAEKKFKCTKCSLGYAVERDRVRHEKTCGVVYRCGTCACQYSTREALLTHCTRKQHTVPTDCPPDLRKNNKNKKAKEISKNKEIPAPLILIVMPKAQSDNSTIHESKSTAETCSSRILTSASDQGKVQSEGQKKSHTNQSPRTTYVPILPKVLPSGAIHVEHGKSQSEMSQSVLSFCTLNSAPVGDKECVATSVNVVKDPRQKGSAGEPSRLETGQKETIDFNPSGGTQTVFIYSQTGENVPVQTSSAACCQTEYTSVEQSVQTHSDITLFIPSNPRNLTFGSMSDQSAQTYLASGSYVTGNTSLLTPLTTSKATQAQVTPPSKAAVETQTSGHLVSLKRSHSSQASSHVKKCMRTSKTHSSHTQTNKSDIAKKKSSPNKCFHNKTKRKQSVSSVQTESSKESTDSRLLAPEGQTVSAFPENLCDFADNETQTIALLNDLEATFAESISTQTLESYLTDNPIPDIGVQSSAVQTTETSIGVLSNSDTDIEVSSFQSEAALTRFTLPGVETTPRETRQLHSEIGNSITLPARCQEASSSIVELFADAANGVNCLQMEPYLTRTDKEDSMQAHHIETQTSSPQGHTCSSQGQTHSHTQTMGFDLLQMNMHTQTLDLDNLCQSNMETQTLELNNTFQSHMQTQTFEDFCRSHMETQTFDMDFCLTHNETQTVDEMFDQFLSHMETQTAEDFNLTEFEFSDIQTQTSLSQGSETSMSTQTQNMLNSDRNSVLSMDIETQTNLHSVSISQDIQLTNIETQTLFPELDLTDTYTQTHMSFL